MKTIETDEKSNISGNTTIYRIQDYTRVNDDVITRDNTKCGVK